MVSGVGVCRLCAAMAKLLVFPAAPAWCRGWFIRASKPLALVGGWRGLRCGVFRGRNDRRTARPCRDRWSGILFGLRQIVAPEWRVLLDANFHLVSPSHRCSLMHG